MERVRLESLHLRGFKSFADEVEFRFPEQNTAIIGPNGCGKSNIVDAVLWVLGEQSPSLMRLKSMGNVVFSGSEKRAPAGSAEVRLTLRSDDGRWSDNEGIVVISRRVFRTGPSEYRINGKVARLRDVIDELLAVGLGTRDYAIIEQGRVGQVLAARPTERRSLLEEAAGITHYKVRRREAELKLEHTRHNLERLEDVIDEVERSQRQLKRQASQARRHAKLEDELKLQIRHLLTREVRELDQERTAIDRRRAQLANESAAAAASLGGVEADLKASRTELEGTRRQVAEAKDEVAALVASRERLEAFLERSADLLDSLREAGDRARREANATSSSHQDVLARCTEASRGHERQSTALHEVKLRVESDTEATARAGDELQQAEEAAAGQRKDLLRVISTLTESRNRMSNLEREQDRLAYSSGQVDQELERLATRETGQATAYSDACTASRAATGQVELLEDRRHQLAERRAGAQELAITAKHEEETASHSLWEQRHRLQGVERDLARHAAVVDQIAAFLPPDSVAGQVGDYLDPAGGSEAMLDRVWGPWLELPVIEQSVLGPACTEALAEIEGRLRLAVRTAETEPPDRLTVTQARDLTALAGIAEQDRGWLLRVLPPAFSCEDEATARDLAARHPEALFLDPDGTVWQGRTVEPATTAVASLGRLALGLQRDELARHVESGHLQAAAAGQRHAELEAQVEQLDAELDSVHRELVAAEQERARRAAVEQALGAELARLRRELASLRSESERNRGQKRQLAPRALELGRDIDSLERRSLQMEQVVEECEATVVKLRDAASESVRRLDRWKAEARLATERVEAAHGEVQRLDTERKNLEARQATLTRDIERFARELSSTEDEVVRSRTRLAEEQGMLTSARESERRLGESVEATSDRVSRLENEVQRRRREHEVCRESLHAVEVEQTRTDVEWERLRDAAHSELGLAPEQLLGGELETETTAEELRAAVDRLREQLDKLGPVNLLAVKEADELSERLSFLREQREDLVDSLRSLLATVREIDTTCSERFVHTFEQVNVVFAETFVELFGGGNARLELVDEDDPLESGVDITAQPPGKKTQSVQLLSGGEKALTALALLISLFRIKPSPFCVLDEVDAPLDDANVERLAHLVAAMSASVQFVLITHNRRTMTHSDVLYGVTMEEPGVSKVVSVRIED